jgi:NAD(P)-dependent dehydrogenase (short-subunit alcohol dehydrogenase family)
VVTGSASGIGAATRKLLLGEGHTVIGVDIAGAEIEVDLSDPGERSRLAATVEAASGGTVDAVIACAGIGSGYVADAPDPDRRLRDIVRVNYFGAVASLAGLRPLLARSEAPRAATITSIVYPVSADDPMIAACLAGDEEGAIELCAAEPYTNPQQAYSASKRALARWVRGNAPAPDWAGAGIALNAVGPGVINTPMANYLLATPELRARVTEGRPMPLRGYGEPEHVAALLAWLTSPANAFMAGQIIFIDGGNDAVRRGDNYW